MMDDKALEARAYRTFPESDDRAQRCLAALREVAVDARRDALEQEARAQKAEAENERLNGCLSKANAGFEEYERRFYLAQDRADAAEADVDKLLADAIYQREKKEGRRKRRREAEVARRRALAEATQLECNRLAEDVGEPAVVRGVEKAVANLPNVTAVVQAEREK